MTKQKGLIVYLHTGEGFKTPAVAITESFASVKEVEATCTNITMGKETLKLNHFIVTSWKMFLKHPWFFNLMFAMFNTPLIDFPHWCILMLYGKHYSTYLKKIKPAFIVSTHFNSTSTLAMIIKKYKLPIALFGYNSDVILSHRAYITNSTEKYFVASQQGADAMVVDKLKKEKIELCGFPLKENFQKKYSSQIAVRQELGLKNVFTIMVSFGGEGIAQSYDFVNKVMASSINMQMIVICGRNKALYDNLMALKKTHRKASVHLMVKGFVTNMPDYLYCSDISLGKAGLNAVFESIYMKKPFLCLYYMVNEYHCKCFAEKNGFAIPNTPPKSHDEIIAFLQKAAIDKKVLEPYHQKLARHGFQFGLTKLPQTVLSATHVFQKRQVQRKNLFFDLAGTLCSLPIDPIKSATKKTSTTKISKWEEINVAGMRAVCEHPHLQINRHLSAAELTTLIQNFVAEKSIARKLAKKNLKEDKLHRMLKQFLLRTEKTMQSLKKSALITAACKKPNQTELWHQLEKAYIQAELKLVKPFTNTKNDPKPLLKKLKQKGYKLHLISNNLSMVLVAEMLKKCHLDGMFDNVIVSAEAGYRKPHRKFAKAMLNASKIKNGKDATIIGDRLTQDHALADLLNMPSVFVNFETHKDNENVDDIVYTVKIDALHELEKFLL